eukprot:5278530-Pyramimonas_sp.AAC.1
MAHRDSHQRHLRRHRQHRRSPSNHLGLPSLGPAALDRGRQVHRALILARCPCARGRALDLLGAAVAAP